jgi:hypothetical protein
MEGRAIQLDDRTGEIIPCEELKKKWTEPQGSVGLYQKFTLCHVLSWEQAEKVLEKAITQPGMVTQACNLSYSGGRGRRILNSRQGQTNLAEPYLKDKIPTKGLETWLQG